jgi:hypothetical protein
MARGVGGALVRVFSVSPPSAPSSSDPPSSPGKVYLPRPGWRVSKKEARIVGEVADEITEHLGRPCTAEEFLNHARKPSSPAHALFEWNVKQAAQRYWLDRARYLLRSYVIEEIRNGEIKKFRARVVVRGDREQGYQDSQGVRDNKPLSKQYEEELIEDLLFFVRRYADYCEFLGKPVLGKVGASLVERIKEFLKAYGKAV